MKSTVLKLVVLPIVLFASGQSYAQMPGSLNGNIPAPAVIVPPMAPAPQTSPNPPSPIGVNSSPLSIPSFQFQQFQGTGGRRR